MLCFAPWRSPATERLSTWQISRPWRHSWRLAVGRAAAQFPSGLPWAWSGSPIPTWMTRAGRGHQGGGARDAGPGALDASSSSGRRSWTAYPIPFLGRKRGWIVLMQAALLVLGSRSPPSPAGPMPYWRSARWRMATALRVRHPGHRDRRATRSRCCAARSTARAVRRARSPSTARAMLDLGRRLAVTARGVDGLAARERACWRSFYLPADADRRWAPEPESLPPPPQSLREAVWGPFVGLLAPAPRAGDPGLRRPATS